MQKIVDKILAKVANPLLLDQLDQLSQSELNTMLLEVFRRKSAKVTPQQLLDGYKNNRFVVPSDIDPIRLRETELQWLKLANSHYFEPIVLSPLAPLGSSSVVAEVDQNNVVSALRGSEVVSDATNVLALILSNYFKDKLNKKSKKHHVTIHRHTRGQAFDNPRFSAHFSTCCLASGGWDIGNYGFELEELEHHLELIYSILHQYYTEDKLSLKFYVKQDGDRILEKVRLQQGSTWSDKQYEVADHKEHAYYDLLQFKIFIHKDGQSYNIADGGFVDWTQKLLSNKKHRCIISGIGIELLHRLLE